MFEPTPVPVRLMVCGLPVPSSVTVTAAVRVPSAVGVKVTEMIQLAPTASAVPQVLVCAKSLAFVPVTAMGLVNATEPFAVTVTVMAALVVLRYRLGRVRLEGVNVRVAAVPVPERLTDWGLPLAVSVIVRVPESAPIAVGVKVTSMVQVALAATVLPQLLVSAKSPLVAIDKTVNAELPVLVKETT
jgi:hypothetical protein